MSLSCHCGNTSRLRSSVSYTRKYVFNRWAFPDPSVDVMREVTVDLKERCAAHDLVERLDIFTDLEDVRLLMYIRLQRGTASQPASNAAGCVLAQ